MSYQANTAWRLDYLEQPREFEATSPATFDVVEGGGADARARRGVQADFVVRMRLVVLAMAAFVVLGAARVAITTATVDCLRANLQVQAAIAQAEETNSALRIERSVLSSTARITRIATQNYGMYYTTAREHLDVRPADEAAELKTAEVASGVPTANVTAPDADELARASYDQMVETATRGNLSGVMSAHIEAARGLLVQN